MEENEPKSMEERFLKRHYLVFIIGAFLSGILATSFSHVINRVIDRNIFDEPDTPFSVSETTEYFPLEEGNVWVYEGRYDYTKDNSNVVADKTVTLRMEVLQVHKFEHLTVAVLRGWPFDYVSTSGQSEITALLAVGNKLYHMTDSQAIDRAIREESAFNLLSEDDIFLEFPLSKGMRFGQIMQMGRSKPTYIWHVEDEFDAATSFSRRSRRAYRVALRELPGHSVMVFQPHVGIIEYDYEHHGTVDKLHLELVRFVAKRRSR